MYVQITAIYEIDFTHSITICPLSLHYIEKLLTDGWQLEVLFQALRHAYKV